ncbi:MAG: YihY/virulence factor BrkB family protein [Myxococcaceae bacterium]|nr:YihY/virulence factor BrkB family protein [Myxococcaceae bacterium]
MLFPELKGLSLKEVLRQLYRELSDDAVTDTAAQLSFYFLFALFPFLVFLTTLIAYLPLHGAAEALLERLGTVMPDEALAVVQRHFDSLLNQPRPKLLSVGLLVTLWTSSRGVNALRKGLNLAYDVPESRPFWHTQAIAIGVTIASALLIILAFSAFILGGDLGAWLAAKAHISEAFAMVWSLARWPFTAMVVMLAAALCYYLLPDVQQRFRYITPGSVTATGLWLLSTWGFSQYVEHFGRFNVTYGSIGGVAVLLLWFYISGLVFLVGGEVNAVVEFMSKGGKVKGARAEGQAPLPLQERPGAAPPGAAKLASSAKRQRQKLRRLLRLHGSRDRHQPGELTDSEPPDDRR